MIAPAPGCSLIFRVIVLISEWSVLPDSAVLSLEVVSFPCHKDVFNQSCSSLEPKVPAEERLRAKETGAKWREGCQAFLLLVGSSEESVCFSKGGF
jgi:hypothetical protein